MNVTTCVITLALLVGAFHLCLGGDVTTDQASKALKQKKSKVFVLDVRKPEEYAKGHLKGAVLMDYYQPDFEAKLKTIPKTSSILIYCATGRRSAETMKKLEGLGYKNVDNMLGGFVAWSKEGKPYKK